MIQSRLLSKFKFPTILFFFFFCSTLRIGPYLFYLEKFTTRFKTTEKTCSAGQSEFKDLTIKLQSSPAHLGTSWHQLRKWSYQSFGFGRKWRFSSARYRADNFEVNPFFLNSPVKDNSRYPTESVPLLISYHSLLPFKCSWRGAKTFSSDLVKFEVWLSKLWILIDRQKMTLSPVWTGSWKRR